jgi:hypothetical protein
MEWTKPSLAMMVALTAVMFVTSSSLWIVFAPIWWRAVRTGRLLARGITYDRGGTPIRYWSGFLGMFFIAMLVTALTAGVMFDTALKLGAYLVAN